MPASRVKRELRVIGHKISPQGKRLKDSLCSCDFLMSGLKTVCLVLFYYCFSITLTFYNKYFIHRYKFPLSITMVHLVTKFLMASFIRTLYKCKTGKSRVTLPWKVYVSRLALAGITSSFDISLSNWSFEFITVSLYTMSKTSVIIFILAFSLLFRLEKARWSLIVVVAFIFLGLFLFTFESTQFNLFGFVLVMTASFLSGLRWTLAQMITQKDEIGLTHPLDMMYHMQPWMILSLMLLQVPMEGVAIAGTQYAFGFHQYSVLGDSILLVMFGACLAFMLEFSEFLLLSKTSSLTLSISGILKEICIILIALKWNKDVITPVNGIGLVLCLCGIIAHIIIKAQSRNEESGDTSNKDTATQNLISQSDSEEEVELFKMSNGSSR